MDSRYIYFNSRERLKLILTMSEITFFNLQKCFENLSEHQYVKHQVAFFFFFFPSGDNYMFHAN